MKRRIKFCFSIVLLLNTIFTIAIIQVFAENKTIIGSVNGQEISMDKDLVGLENKSESSTTDSVINQSDREIISSEKISMENQNSNSTSTSTYHGDKLSSSEEEITLSNDLEYSEETSETKKNSLETRQLSVIGEDYSISVSFTSEAGISDTAELKARELVKDSEEYRQCLDQAMDAMDMDSIPMFCRFFDISFVDNGSKIEPSAPVDVMITYFDPVPVIETNQCTAVHFAESGLELIEARLETTNDGDAITFTQEGFSIVGTVIEGDVALTQGQKYIFYTGDNNALGVSRKNNENYSIAPIQVKVENNGYVTPFSADVDISDITWIYQNGGLYNPSANKYLDLVASTPKQVTGTLRYTSTVGLSTSIKTIYSKEISNTLRISQNYDDLQPFLLAYENGIYKSGTEFDNAQLYHLTAIVRNVSDDLVNSEDLVVKDAIRESGCIKPHWNNFIPEGKLTYRWEKSIDGGAHWENVNRENITGEQYNVAENGEWLNVSLDSGAEALYRVSLVEIDGQPLEKRVTSEVYRVLYFSKLKNGGFEKPDILQSSSAGDYQPFLPNETFDMVWKTTATDGQIEYISVGSPDFQDLSQKWHLCEAANDGVQYVELNATQEGALYQDVLTVPGSKMYWQLAHRARGTTYMSGQSDTMYVVIMSTVLAEKYNVTTQQAVQDVINYPQNYPGAVVRSITSDNKSWQLYQGEYIVPESQYLSRYFFVSGSTASNDVTVGNHLDSVSFSINLPPPEPNETNVEIVKEIKGLTYEDALKVLQKLQFSIQNVSSGEKNQIWGTEFSQLINNGNGTFVAKYVKQGITPGDYDIKEDTNNGIADFDGYDRSTFIKSEDTVEDAYYSEGFHGVVVRAEGGKTSSITIHNSYVKEQVSISIVKKGDNGKFLTAGFELASVNGDTWDTLQVFDTNDGEKILSELRYNQLYRLTENKVPDGYIGLTDPVYFMINSDGIQLCSVDGTKLPEHDGILIDGLQIVVINKSNYILPDAGGSGILHYKTAGILLMSISILVLCGLKYTNKRKI